MVFYRQKFGTVKFAFIVNKFYIRTKLCQLCEGKMQKNRIWKIASQKRLYLDKFQKSFYVSCFFTVPCKKIFFYDYMIHFKIFGIDISMGNHWWYYKNITRAHLNFSVLYTVRAATRQHNIDFVKLVVMYFYWIILIRKCANKNIFFKIRNIFAVHFYINHGVPSVFWNYYT